MIHFCEKSVFYYVLTPCLVLVLLLRFEKQSGGTQAWDLGPPKAPNTNAPACWFATMRPNKGPINKKWLALVALVVQNSLQSVVMRYTLVSGEASARYMTSTAVLMSEVMKLCISVLCCFVVDAGANVAKFKTEASGSADWLKLGGTCRWKGVRLCSPPIFYQAPHPKSSTCLCSFF
jgi:hypothetical protein